MPSLKLTDAAVQRLKGERDKRVEYFDVAEPGFALRISGTVERPKKSWVFFYRVKGEVPPPGKKRAPVRRLTIGSYPAYGLKDAKEIAREAKKLADQGTDPAVARRDTAAATQLTAREMRTLTSVVDEFMVRFMEHGRRPHAPRYIAETRRNFTNHVLPVWGGRDIKLIARRDVIALLDDIADGSGPIAANRTRAALSTMFNWALRRDLVVANPVLQTDPPGQEARHERVLADGEIVAFWKAAVELGYPFGAFDRFLLATGQRRSEAASMRRQDIDESTRTWVIPSPMTKNRKQPHAVPLSAIAMQILEGCERISDTYVFATRRDRPISGFSKAKAELDAALEKAGCPLPQWTFHDLRRTCATGLGGLKVSRFIIGRVLNHADRSVTGIYDRHEYLDEKRAALDAWSKYLTRLIDPGAPSNVVELPQPSKNIVELSAAR